MFPSCSHQSVRRDSRGRCAQEHALLHREERADRPEGLSEGLVEACGEARIQEREETIRHQRHRSGHGEAETSVREEGGSPHPRTAEHPRHLRSPLREQRPSPGQSDRLCAERRCLRSLLPSAWTQHALRLRHGRVRHGYGDTCTGGSHDAS